MDKLLKLTENGDLIDLEFNAICRAADYSMIEVPIFSTSRRSGETTTSLHSAYGMYAGAWRLKKSIGL
jgi:hypothetical protein